MKDHKDNRPKPLEPLIPIKEESKKIKQAIRDMQNEGGPVLPQDDGIPKEEETWLDKMVDKFFNLFKS